MPCGSRRLDVESRGSPGPCPTALVCVCGEVYLTSPYLTLGVVPASRPARRRARPARWRRVPAAAAAAAAPAAAAAAAAAAALAAASPARLWRRLNPHASRPPPPGRRGATRAAAGVVPLPDHARRHGAASDDALRHDIRLGAARALDPVARDVPDGRMRRPSPPWRPRAPTLRIRFPRIPKGLP